MDDTAPTQTGGSGEQTRLALIEEALALFGSKGFDATSTREIAARAGVNIGSIAYHFGGKEGLREACAGHIVERMRMTIGPMLADGVSVPTGREAALALLDAVFERMIRFVTASREAGPIVQFVLREMSQPSAAFDIVYDGVFAPVHKRLCQLWEAATGEPAESETARLAVFTLVGQVIYFRIGREAVLRRMDWGSIGSAEAEKIAEVARSNIAAILAARRGGQS